MGWDSDATTVGFGLGCSIEYKGARACGQGSVNCAPAVVLDETADKVSWIKCFLSYSGLRRMGSTDHLSVVLGKGAG